jgi:peptide chain release factor subunit 3
LQLLQRLCLTKQTRERFKMSDSWDSEAGASDAAAPKMNVTAKEWTPSWMAAPAPAAAAPAAPAAPAPAAPAAPVVEAPVESQAKSPVVAEEEAPKPAVEEAAAAAAAPEAASGAAQDDDDEEEEEEEENEEEQVEEVAVEEEVEELEEVTDDTPYPDGLLESLDKREHLNIVFIGHVDAGKSTLSGSILYLMGAVDKRTIEKFEREAKDRNRESWFLAFIMDTNEEERAKGKTVEVGRAHFETEAKRYTILDAPGHKNYVPAMITGASQADVGILVISARKGEFESGFDKLGQTREHAMLARTLGVQKLVVVINKMDESTVMWSKERFDECVKKLTPYLKNECHYRVKRDVLFVPISAITGAGVLKPVGPEVSQWASELNGGKSMIQILDDLSISGRDEKAPCRVTVIDSYTDRGVVVMGKVESGVVFKGQKLQAHPVKKIAKVVGILINEDEAEGARPGENIHIKLTGVNEEDVQKGFVLSSIKFPVHGVKRFVGQIILLDLLEHRPLFTAGYQAVFHAHTAIEECTVVKLLKEVDNKTGRPFKKAPHFGKAGATLVVEIEVVRTVCVEPFKVTPQLGRFTLRDEGKSIAIGVVLAISDSAADQ